MLTVVIAKKPACSAPSASPPMKTSPDPIEVYTAVGWCNEMCGSQEKGWTFVPRPGNREPSEPQAVQHGYECLVEYACDSRGGEGRLSSFQPMSCCLMAILSSGYSPSSLIGSLSFRGFVSGFALCLYSILSSIDETVGQTISITRRERFAGTKHSSPPKPYVIVIIGRE